MSFFEPSKAEPPIEEGDRALDRIVADLERVIEPYEFERLYDEGLALAASIEQRDRVLLAAAARLADLNTQSGSSSGLDRTWLSRLATEVIARGGELSPALVGAAQRVMQATVFEAQPDLDAWHGGELAGEAVADFIRRSPRSASSLRDLGRLVQRLRGVGALALVDGDTLDRITRFYELLVGTTSPTVPSVGEWMRISRNDLLRWAETEDAPNRLPLLIRRLVAETGRGITALHIPGGSAVTSGGWDGTVDADESSPYVPAGRSGWELSVEKNSLAKAESDFEARVRSIPPAARQQMTFIEVVCRPWTKAAHFQAGAKARNEFSDVRSYNVDDLETWLEQAPATTLWLREVIGHPIDGIRTISDIWQNWLQSTEPSLDTPVVLAGRGSVIDELQVRAKSAPGITTVGGDARLDEILAFLGGVWHSPQRVNDLSLRELVVASNGDSASRLVRTQNGMVILLTRPEFATDIPPASKHHVFVAVPGGERADIILPPIDQATVSQYFRESGTEFHAAAELGALARRSLAALRRYLAMEPELYRPEWAREAAPLLLRRALLLGAWNRSRAADRGAVERLLGETYAVAEERLRRYARSADDPFVGLVDERWHVISSTDSWLLLGSQITSSDLQAFRELVRDVLTDVDPVLAMPEEERWRASMDGVTPSFSTQLRHGLARTLALLATIGTPNELGDGRSGTSVAREIVWNTLQVARENSTVETWVAVAPELSLLAEAAPSEVIRAVRDTIDSAPWLMAQIFTDQETTPFGSLRSSPHTYFLRALEVLAWSPEYFDDAVSLLASLDTLDPGGKWGNRPDASLKSIFAPLRPSTSAPASQRVAALGRLRRRHPELAWKMMVSMLPSAAAPTLVQRGPEYRDWKSGEPIISVGEYREVIDSVSASLIQDAGMDVGRWVTLVGEIDGLSSDRRDELRAALGQLARVLLDERDRRAIWDALRGFLSRHREYADARWALPGTVLQTFDPLVVAFRPENPQLRYEWLFGEGLPELGDRRRRDDPQEYEAELERRRRDAVGEILADGGIESVVAFSNSVRLPGLVGLALARHTQSNEFDDELLVRLGGALDAANALAFGFFGERFRQRGWEYLDSVIQSHPLSELASARLLRSSWAPSEGAERADALGEAVSTEFWREFTYFGLGPQVDGVVDVSKRLRRVGRSAAALDFLVLYAQHNEGPEFAGAVADALEDLMQKSGDDPEIARLHEYDFDLLLKIVARYREAIGRERAVRLEWFFLPALGFEPDAHSLHRALAEDPAMFVQMVTFVYRPAHQTDEDRQPLTDAERHAAENAFRLLHSWRTSPGVDQNGVMHGNRLLEWVTEARRLLAEVDRVAVGDEEIGQALVAAPEDEFAWPCKEVRDLLEELQNDHVDSGFSRRIFNNRGATSRSFDEGGKQEWALVEQYRAAARQVRPTWQRLGRIFDRLAETYEQDARREDATAERRRRGLD
jgi:hypothetical protein